MKLKDARVIITGAGSGFGLHLAQAMTKMECRVAAFDIDAQKLSDLKTRCPEVKTFCCNVADNNEVESNIDRVFEEFDGLEILVNNAGIMKNSPLVNLLRREDSRHPVDLWHQVINVNQHSVFFMTRSVVSQMIKRRNTGVIINISSISAQGNIGQTAYSASKAAVEAMSVVWAKELGRFGIRSMAIAPGFINTQGGADAIEEKMLKQWIDKTPLGRTGEISEVVDTVLFVIENDFMNGQVIQVDGGLRL